MTSSSNKMLFTCLVASSLVAMATAAGNEYLPPSKGYNYEPPSVPFPSYNTGHTPPAPRPTLPAPRPSYGPPSNGYEDHQHGQQEHHHEPGMPFDFAYAVKENGNDYSHNAVSDGDVTRGEYRVALPDGRTQIVKYTADWKNGFNAEVSYEGEAKYPDPPAGGYGKGPDAPSGGYGKGPASPGAGPGQAYVPPSQGGGYQY